MFRQAIDQMRHHLAKECPCCFCVTEVHSHHLLHGQVNGGRLMKHAPRNAPSCQLHAIGAEERLAEAVRLESTHHAARSMARGWPKATDLRCAG
jgi:hypothetical protein